MNALRRLGNRPMVGSDKAIALAPPSTSNKKSAVLTFFAAIISFVLGLVVIVSNARANGLRDNSMASFNMSTVGQDLIKIYPANGSNSPGAGGTGLGRRMVGSEDVGSPIANRQHRAREVEVEVREVVSNTVGKQVMGREALPAPDPTPAPDPKAGILPSKEEVDEFFRSAGNAVATKIAPNAPLSTGAPLAAPANGPSGDPLNDIGTLFGGLLGNLTGAAGNGLQSIADSAVEGLLRSAGIQEWYGLYLTEYCSGNWSPRYSDPNAELQVTECKKYMDIETPSKVVNSTFQVGNQIVDIAPLNLINNLASLTVYINALLTALIVLLSLHIVFSALIIFSIPLYLLLSILRTDRVSLILGSLIALDVITIQIVAILVTVLAIVATLLGNDLLGDLGVQADKGGATLAMLWVSAVFMSIGAACWFVSLFRRTFVRRKRVEVVLGESGGEKSRGTTRGGDGDEDEEALGSFYGTGPGTAASVERRSLASLDGEEVRGGRSRGGEGNSTSWV
ncbi:hypothetical protein HYFRA_00002275 [Hymenoscyphus fraxineus]|uniref:Uncharacterized protein n=1 Tax=Hymenoscyphus fraxineus TaxID=746836 RepID=A0A9N9PNF0_9HELO|nr:hypothetical protein HYFRA_00002275 [Hymenoscyphus fraxineus]